MFNATAGEARQAVRQAELEFYIWANNSYFPFLQLVTDLQTGGVAFYRQPSLSGFVLAVEFAVETLKGTQSVRQFLQEAARRLPEGSGADNPDGLLNLPDGFSSPTRRRSHTHAFKSMWRSDPPPQESQSKRRAAWRLISALANNPHDVGNMGSLEGFDKLEPEPEGIAA